MIEKRILYNDCFNRKQKRNIGHLITFTFCVLFRIQYKYNSYNTNETYDIHEESNCLIYTINGRPCILDRGKLLLNNVCCNLCTSYDI